MEATLVELAREDWEKAGEYPNYRIPGIVRTDKGTILVCCECRYGYDWSAMDIGIRRSTDEGRTWSQRQVVVPGKGIDVVHNAVMFADRERVHMVWHKNYRQAFYMYSDDEGLSWSEPRQITSAYEALRSQYNWTVIAAGPGHGLVTSTGRLIVPVWLASNRHCITEHRPSVISTLYSDDRGETWHCGQIIPAGPDFVNPSESVLAELADGGFLICCRHETPLDWDQPDRKEDQWNSMRLRKLAFSPDGISNWHDWRFEPSLPDCTCSAGMTQGKGKIWLSNCPAPGRMHLSLSVSSDQGATWRRVKEVVRYGGYSDIYFHPDTGRIYMIAETYDSDEKEIMGKLSLKFFCIESTEVE